MATMFDIDKATLEYSAAHDVLAGLITEIDEAVMKIKRDRMPALRKAVEKAAAKKANLRGLIDDSRDQFEKPKTRILHGVKIGIIKGKGKLGWDDDAQTVFLIRKHFSKAIAETMIRVKETPISEALNQLDVKLLRAIGVRAEETGDQIVIKPTDSEIDKMVDALLQENDEPEAAESLR